MTSETATATLTIIPEPARLATPLAPVIAGARARGVADALEWLGFAAILLDDRGEALHVSAGASDLMGQALFLERGRLRCRDAEADEALEGAIRTALVGELEANLTIPGDPGRDPVQIRIAAFEGGADAPFQLLRAVAILESSAERFENVAGMRH